MSSNEDIKDFKKSVALTYGYYVNTTKMKYFFEFLDYPINAIHPDNKGIYSLHVVRVEDKDKAVINWEDMKAGIYDPMK